MYLSHLLIDVGGNPDRPRPGRRWLGNIYHVHQRLCMAFPSEARVQRDGDFLQPFKEEDFPLLRNPDAKPEDPRHSFLFRIDNSTKENSPRAIILVQSAFKPDWHYAFHNANAFLAAPPECKPYDPTFTAKQELRFRIRINLSKKGKTSKDGADLRTPRNGTDKKGRPKDQGKRVSLTWDEDQGPDEAIQDWFAGKGEHHGFALRDFHLLQVGWVTGYRPGKKTPCDEHDDGHPERRMKFRSALLEGTLTVTDAAALQQVIASGIGSAKAFGFGLMSLLPLS